MLAFTIRRGSGSFRKNSSVGCFTIRRERRRTTLTTTRRNREHAGGPVVVASCVSLLSSFHSWMPTTCYSSYTGSCYSSTNTHHSQNRNTTSNSKEDKNNTTTTLRFRELQRREPGAVTKFLHQLREQGFACLEIHEDDEYDDNCTIDDHDDGRNQCDASPTANATDSSSNNTNTNNENNTIKHNPRYHHRILQGLHEGIVDAAHLKNEFRFPPHNTNPNTTSTSIVYSPSQRRAFRSLFAIATCCVRAIVDAALLSSSSSSATATQSRNTTSGTGIRSCLDDQQQQQLLVEALQELSKNEGDRSTCQLFGGSNTDATTTNTNEPFSNPQQPFAQSFFNLFNYKYGSLNAHVDRSLVTVIYSLSALPSSSISLSSSSSVCNNTETNNDAGVDDISTNNNNTTTRSKLWIQNKKGIWHDADHYCHQQHQGTSRSNNFSSTATNYINNNSSTNSSSGNHNHNHNRVIVMIGEDLEETGIAESLGLYAASHAVRVDPFGPYIERSHYRPDPEEETKKANTTGTTTTTNNNNNTASNRVSTTNINTTHNNSSRVSAALILRHDPEINSN